MSQTNHKPNYFQRLLGSKDEAAELRQIELEGKVAAIDKSQAVIEFELDGTILTANDNFLNAVGYRLEEIQGQHHRIFVAPDDRESAAYQQFWQKLRRGEFDAGQYKRITKDGREIWIQASYNPIMGSDGHPLKVVKFATDVTADKLRNADYEGQIAAIGKAQAVIEFELDGTIRNANENFRNALGYSLDEIKGQHHRMFVDAEERETPAYQAFWTKLGRGEYDSGQYKRVTKDGREIWIQASYNPIFDASGKPIKVVKFATDITADKLRNADYQGQIDAISKVQAVIEFNLDGTIREANSNFLQALGYSLDEIKGQHHRMFVDPAERETATYAAFWQKLGRGEFDAGRYKRVTKGGDEIWIQASYNPIMDMNGRPFKVVKYATDITDQVRANQAIKDAVAQTQEVVAAASSGDLSQRIPTDGKEGQLLELCTGINTMLDDISANRERERLVAAENLRIKNALDNVSSNVMIADNDRNIVYMNESVIDMLRGNEAELRKVLPSFDVDKLQGGSIDQFHRNPAHQKSLLEALKTTHNTQIKVGPLHFGLIANPIVNSEGERLGSVVEWLDRTAQVSVESEIGEIVAGAAAGDFSNRLSLEGKDGFYLNLAGGINSLIETSEGGIRDVMRVLSAVEQGDLTKTIDADYQGMLGELKHNVNSTITGLCDLVISIKSSAEEIAGAAGDVSSGSEDLSTRTEEQAASLEETASSMEELTSTVKQNADSAMQANQQAIGASEIATSGGQVVGEVVTRMAEITASSKKIEDIISVIEGIAFQTNILALNAAVEAARAGEQGRGFAVVASEVRSLAQRSSGAAKEIKQLISDSVEQIEDGQKLVERSGETMQEIVTAVKRVTDIMAEISAASQEQSSGIEQVNQTIAQMDEATQQNAALVEQSSAAARSMAEQTQTLSMAVQRFHLGEEEVKAATKPSEKPAASKKAKAGPKPATAEAKRDKAPEPPAAAVIAEQPNGAAGSGSQWAEF